MTLTTTIALMLLFLAAYAVAYFLYHGIRDFVKDIAILYQD